MKILITGASGFIGSALSRRLASNGHEVMALSRNPEKTRASLPFVHDVYQWRPGEAPVEAVAGADVVVNVAGETVAGRWTTEKKQRIYDSRIQGTRSLVAAIGWPRPRRLT
jgi:NAD dependent epimerase/dehydratase family enzyme